MRQKRLRTPALGSAKYVHKLVAVYFILANLHSFNHLINQEEFFKPLIDDLKLLETEGIDAGFPCKVRGRVVCIAGDNLGQHWIGEQSSQPLRENREKYLLLFQSGKKQGLFQLHEISGNFMN